MTAATTAAAASQELSQSGKSLDPSRAGTKYPVQESLTSILHTRAPTSKNSMKMVGLVWKLGFQTINSLKRWNHQFETQIKRHIFQLEVDKL